jgi:hypothetical protein
MTALLVGILVFVIVGAYLGSREAKNKKKYCIKFFVVFPIFASLPFLFGPLFLISPIKIGYTKAEGDNVTVYYPTSVDQVSLKRTKEGRPQDGELVSQDEIVGLALEYGETAVSTNSAFYKIPVETKLLLAATDNDLFRFGGVIRGGGTGNDFGIIIQQEYLNEKLITHELSHKTIRKTLGVIDSLKIPKWFDEGVAVYVADQNEYISKEELKEGLTDGSFTWDLNRWEGFLGNLSWKFSDIQKHRRVYGQMYEFMNYLSGRYGEDKIYQVVIATKDESFEDAFKNTLGLTPDEAFLDFMQSLEEDY